MSEDIMQAIKWWDWFEKYHWKGIRCKSLRTLIFLLYQIHQKYLIEKYGSLENFEKAFNPETAREVEIKDISFLDVLESLKGEDVIEMLKPLETISRRTAYDYLAAVKIIKTRL